VFSVLSKPTGQTVKHLLKTLIMDPSTNTPTRCRVRLQVGRCGVIDYSYTDSPWKLFA
jgi:hypothetical protein